MSSMSNEGTIDDYIGRFPESTQQLLEQLRASIRKAAPEAQEVMKYGMPTLVLKGNLVHFAAYKSHIGFYPGASAIQTFADELTPYECAKGTVRFPLTGSLPHDLIRRIVLFRIERNRQKLARKAQKPVPAGRM